jgi:hypothetical protein
MKASGSDEGDGGARPSRDIAALIGPLVPDTPAAKARERKAEREEIEHRANVGAWASLTAMALLILFLTPGISGIEAELLIFVWGALALPLFAGAFVALRHGRLPLGRGRSLRGAKARRAGILMLLAGLFLVLGRPALEWIFGPV